MVRQHYLLNSLQAFEAAARHLSFVKAADELSVTPAAVSHQVKRLEEYLGTQLFRRRPRGLLLAETGQLLAAELRVSSSLGLIDFQRDAFDAAVRHGAWPVCRPREREIVRRVRYANV